MNSIPQNLKRIRTERNLTQQQLADILSVTQQTVSNWEKAKAVPDIPMLQDVADKLGVEMYELLYDIDSDRKNIKKKVRIQVTASVILLIVFVVSYTAGTWLKRRNLNMEVYWFSRLFIFPLMMFVIFYTTVLFYKSKLKTDKGKFMPVRYFAQGLILLFMGRTVILYISVMFFNLSPRPQLFFDIWHITANTPWVYAVMGVVYAFAENISYQNPVKTTK